jgi:hypothetical protein
VIDPEAITMAQGLQSLVFDQKRERAVARLVCFLGPRGPKPIYRLRCLSWCDPPMQRCPLGEFSNHRRQFST